MPIRPPQPPPAPAVNAFDPANWYWIVGGSSTQVYSSAAVAYIPVTDPTYSAWIADSRNKTVTIALEQDLFDQLADAGVSIPATATISDTEKAKLLNRADKTIFKILFNHENRIRVLEGKTTITKAQFITVVMALI